LLCIQRIVFYKVGVQASDTNAHLRLIQAEQQQMRQDANQLIDNVRRLRAASDVRY
jgi:hypothetical protein